MAIIKFTAGLAVGYVLGARAGRERYEQIVAGARKAQSHPAVTQAQQKVQSLLGTAPDTSTATADPVPDDTVELVAAGSPTPRHSRRPPRTTPPVA
ncbi:hypothetical protein BJ973_000441 [Actinoplanes tereljensis]|uniref:Protoporphyrinogen oxidase n=1 Tax=Paractinoplanes tereljensis TaxID=571912 RepID=A0A919NRX1_9ACTN|nr:hypothetical protein [Actinoplanes tereljensis]GIF23203.1 hypothetical protein Ate02nite_59330 [Actinoplanes tereljensis]